MTSDIIDQWRANLWRCPWCGEGMKITDRWQHVCRPVQQESDSADSESTDHEAPDADLQV